MTKEYIESLIKNEVRESTTLEYKSGESLLKLLEKKENDISEFTKDISAMANSAGGKIIYGIQEFKEKEKKGCAEKITPIEKNKISVEWLGQLISSRIQPPIQNFRIIPIDLDLANFVIIIELEQSITVHQSNDKRYYKRNDIQVLRMDDWEIKALANRFNRALVKEKIYIQQIPNYLGKLLGKLRTYDYELIIAVENIGNIMANYLSCFIQFDKIAYSIMELKNLEVTHKKNKFELFLNNKTFLKVNFQNQEIVIGSEYEPILPNSWRQLKAIPINENFFKNEINIQINIMTENSTFESFYISTELEVIRN